MSPRPRRVGLARLAALALGLVLVAAGTPVSAAEAPASVPVEIAPVGPEGLGGLALLARSDTGTSVQLLVVGAPPGTSAAELPAAVAGRVLATSEGNPLFVGELVRMLVHDGVLKRDGERWTMGVELADLEMPPTIHALLAARIDRLRATERTVLERAAVVGRQF